MAASGCSGDSDPEAKFRAWFNNLKFRVAFKKSYEGWLEVTTDLDPKSDTEPDVGTLCEAAFKAADLAELRDGIKAVHVKGAYGEPGGCA